MLLRVTKAWEDQSLFDRMDTAVERVRDRLRRATAALDAARLPFAVVGGNAVAAWVASVDPSAVRNNQDIDILFREADLDAVERALTGADFERVRVGNSHSFADVVHRHRRNRVRARLIDTEVTINLPADALFKPSADGSFAFRVLPLDALLAHSLRSFTLNDCVDVRDMIDVGLIDASWKAGLPLDLAERLQYLIDTPEG